jgi:hypothetical protein
VFGAGLLTFQTPSPTTLTGTFDMGSDLVLSLGRRLPIWWAGLSEFRVDTLSSLIRSSKPPT